MNQNEKIFSIDDGYGDIKADSGKGTLYIPSAYADYSENVKSNFTQGTQTTSLSSNPNFRYIAHKSDFGKFVVGEHALNKKVDIDWYGGSNKHEDFGFPILLQTTLGLMTSAKKTEVNTLVMGLPSDKDTDDRRILLQNQVLQTHYFDLELHDGSKLEREVEIQNLVIKKQPFGSFCDVLFNKNGEIERRDIAGMYTTVIDIGSRTLNIYTLDRMEEVTELIKTTNNGMYTSYMRVGKYIESETGYKISNGRLPIIVKGKEFRDYDLSKVIEGSHRMLANEIKTVVDTLLVDAYGYIGMIIFTGGGAEVLKPYLEKIFNTHTHIFLDRLSTARGLRKYGMYLSKQQQ